MWSELKVENISRYLLVEMNKQTTVYVCMCTIVMMRACSRDGSTVR